MEGLYIPSIPIWAQGIEVDTEKQNWFIGNPCLLRSSEEKWLQSSKGGWDNWLLFAEDGCLLFFSLLFLLWGKGFLLTCSQRLLLPLSTLQETKVGWQAKPIKLSLTDEALFPSQENPTCLSAKDKVHIPTNMEIAQSHRVHMAPWMERLHCYLSTTTTKYTTNTTRWDNSTITRATTRTLRAHHETSVPSSDPANHGIIQHHNKPWQQLQHPPKVIHPQEWQVVQIPQIP